MERADYCFQFSGACTAKPLCTFPKCQRQEREFGRKEAPAPTVIAPPVAVAVPPSAAVPDAAPVADEGPKLDLLRPLGDYLSPEQSAAMEDEIERN